MITNFHILIEVNEYGELRFVPCFGAVGSAHWPMERLPAPALLPQWVTPTVVNPISTTWKPADLVSKLRKGELEDMILIRKLKLGVTSQGVRGLSIVWHVYTQAYLTS